MNIDKLIAKQQLEIETLKEQLAEFEEAKSKVYGLLYNVGSPLNDSTLGLTRKQMQPLFQISEALDLL